ncbi:uncharacterized protein LOC126484031 [Schistocerca serialis cubense]|uniref:uncharacterized protein LOC126484031 n=1 Tax=Schistocerca serialis cubense TaxID=2023355 RepID=UPI00214ED6E3|nr:uncharacterized protein LOC126484031 [Schistocerca serialis cubense]
MGQYAVGVCLLFTFATVAVLSSPEYNHIKIENFMECPGNEDMAMEILHHEVERVSKNAIAINLTLNVKTEIKEDYTVVVDLKRCESKYETHTCKQFMTKVKEDLCEHIHDSGEVWSDFIEKTEPAVNCPIKEGIYHSYNAFLDASPLENAPEGYWLVDIRAMKGMKVMGCCRATGHIWPDVIPGDEEEEEGR